MSDPALRVAVVGAGPAGFYASEQLLSSELDVEVDMFDRLPTPFGLVRSGVAPDHPKIKSVTRVFERTAKLPGFRFYGNVEIGRDISREELLACYDAVVYAHGAAGDRRMGIPGEDLPGSLSATAFVNWYNGHPDFVDLDIDLSVSRALVVGNGNVAVDVARMLSLTHRELFATDTAEYAIEALEASRVQEIVLLGRRGPAQAAFTTPELRELGELEGADVIVDPADLELDADTAAWVAEQAPKRVRENLALLAGYAARTPQGRPRRLVLSFLRSPLELRGEERVCEVRVGVNRLQTGTDGRLIASPTGQTESLEAGLVLRAVGYRGIPLPGVPFDEQAHLIPNDRGRVIGPDGPHREYVTGWIKRGPTGIIGTNKRDAQETVDRVVEDAREGRLAPSGADPQAAERLLSERGVAHVRWEGWGAIDAHEVGLGEPHGRPRTKLTAWEELLRIGGGSGG